MVIEPSGLSSTVGTTSPVAEKLLSLKLIKEDAMRCDTALIPGIGVLGSGVDLLCKPSL
ncbi:hypothetical protein CP8484711_0649, partial [Chlamydia psittaci 84-8471/1]